MSIQAAMFGMLGKDAETKTSAAGKPYLRLNIRIGDGDAVQWINAMTFDPDAIAVAESMVKGARIYIEGTLKLDEWSGQDGAKRHGLSLLSWHCRLSQIGRNRPRRTGASCDAPARQQSGAQDYAPERTGRARAATSDYAPIGAEARPPKGHPAFDDDIPF